MRYATYILCAVLMGCSVSAKELEVQKSRLGIVVDRLADLDQRVDRIATRQVQDETEHDEVASWVNSHRTYNDSNDVRTNVRTNYVVIHRMPESK